MGNVFRRSLWVYVGFEWTDGCGKCFSFQQDFAHPNTLWIPHTVFCRLFGNTRDEAYMASLGAF